MLKLKYEEKSPLNSLEFFKINFQNKIIIKLGLNSCQFYIFFKDGKFFFSRMIQHALKDE